MDQYSISAVEKLTRLGDRDYITKKELLKLKTQFSESAKISTPEAVTAQNHLRVLDYLLAEFQGKRKIFLNELRASIDSFLRSAGYVYSVQRHQPAHERRLYDNKRTDTYDLAFYSKLARTLNTSRGHHKGPLGNSIFYCRAERWGETLVWGNLQIDAPSPDFREQPESLNILLRRKNLYRIMLQEAVKHALATGVQRIVFQAGSAAAWAQWARKIIIEKTLITPDNYDALRQKFEEQCVQLEQIPLGLHPMSGPQDSPKPYSRILPDHYPYYKSRFLLVHDKIPKKITGQWIYNPSIYSSLTHALYAYYAHRTATTPEAKCREATYYIYSRLRYLEESARQNQPEKVLQSIDKIFMHLDSNFIESSYSEKIAFIKKLTLDDPKLARRKDLYWTATLRRLDVFLEQFGYDQLVLEACPELKAVDSPRKVRGQKMFYIDTGTGVNEEIQQKDFFCPQIGKHHTNIWEQTPTGQIYPLSPGRLGVYNWYEKTIPEILAANEMEIKKVLLRRIRPGHTVYGWEITSGQEAFARRPLEIF